MEFMNKPTTVAARRRSSERTYPVPALEKGLEVMELLSQTPEELGLNEIAKRLGRSRQELFRVVTCLETRGYLLRDASGMYRLTSKLFQVGSGHSMTQALVSQAMPHMERFAAAVGESCQLMIEQSDWLLAIAAAKTPSVLQIGVRVGATIDLFWTNSGLLAMAFGPENRRRDLWQRRQNARQRGSEVVHPEINTYPAWDARLAEIRAAGYLASNSPMHQGSRGYVAPILDGGKSLLAVVSMFRLLRVDENPPLDKPYVDALLTCSRAISAAFGG